MHINIEIKAHCQSPEKIKTLLVAKSAIFKGVDHQIDTYFKVPKGRLKLREGNIENTLIHYQRSNQAGPKQSDVTLFQTNPPSSLKDVLKNALEILVVVDKQREIYFIDNVKFHLDEVKGLGQFVEIEAIGTPGQDQQSDLLAQCEHYLRLFAIKSKDLIEVSYSDLLGQQQSE